MTSQMMSKKKDYHKKPFEEMVVLGESHVAGGFASSEERWWVNILARMIEDFQGMSLKLFNRGIGANAISPRSPGYENSAKPSAMERYQKDVIALDPDLFILSYGLNDMRAGMPPEEFREEMARIIEDVQKECSPVTVLTTVYYMSAYDLYPPYSVGSIEATEVYNVVIRQLARRYDCLLADIWDAEGQADWVIHPDTVHANDLGHQLIANRVFQAIATNCSSVATRITGDLVGAKKEMASNLDRLRTQPWKAEQETST
jgi:lysophospholipase L1-like esterase